MKSKFLILAAAAMFAACGGNTQKKAAAGGAKDASETVADMHNAENALDYRGTYTGTFPAADCPGIDMRLTLKQDGAYSLHMKYIDRDSEFDEKGTYTVRENLLTLTPTDGQPDYYKVEEDRLRKLDADKQPITGVLAENYVLKKTE